MLKYRLRFQDKRSDVKRIESSRNLSANALQQLKAQWTVDTSQGWQSSSEYRKESTFAEASQTIGDGFAERH